MMSVTLLNRCHRPRSIVSVKFWVIFEAGVYDIIEKRVGIIIPGEGEPSLFLSAIPVENRSRHGVGPQPYGMRIVIKLG